MACERTGEGGGDPLRARSADQPVRDRLLARGVGARAAEKADRQSAS